MNNTSFDRVAKIMAAGETRRGVLRGMAVGLGMAATGVIAGTDAGARKQGKKQKKKQKTCRPGKSIGTVAVPANGSTVRSPMLRKGQAYVLRATGYWSTNATYLNDAVAAFPTANPNAPEKTYQGVRLGLSVDGGSPDQWGAYNTNHVYQRVVAGRGRALTLRFTDPVTADNSGFLTFEVRCK